MADEENHHNLSRQATREWEANDPVVAANSIAQEEPTASISEPSSPVDRSPGDDTDSFDDPEKTKHAALGDEKDGTHRDAIIPINTNTGSVMERTSTHQSNPMWMSGEASMRAPPVKMTFWRRINPLKWNPPPIPVERKIISREARANWLSRLTFQWMQPIMSTGYKRPLELNDIWLVNPKRSSRVLAERLTKSFNMRRKRGDKRPLLGAMYETVKWEFIIGGLCQLGSSVIQSVSPFLLRFLIAFAEDAYYAEHLGDKAPSIGHGLGLVFGILVLQVLSSLCANHFMYRGMMVGGQLRATLMTVIFDKAMRISGRARAGGSSIDLPPPDIRPGSPEEKKWYKKMLKRKKVKMPAKTQDGVLGDGRGWSNGRIINLMSTDTYRIDQASGFFHMLWTAPIQIIITLIELCINLTYAALAGFALLVIAMPVLARAIRTLLIRRMAINKITDQRVTMTQEILSSVRFVKFFGWETSFLERIFAIRKREIFSIQKLLATRNAINAISMSMPVFASMIAFIVYSITHPLNPARVFSSLALFNGLRMPLNFLPLVLGQVTDAISSIRRIQEFLLAEEQEEDFTWDFEAKKAISVNHADFTWERTPTQDPDRIPGKGPRSFGQEKKEKKAAKKAAKQARRVEAKRQKMMKNQDATSDGASDPPENEKEKEPEPYHISDITLDVGRDELIGVIGSVGSGKSSLLAALAGDMRKTGGSVMLGASRAFCPQYAWIQNATVRSNIIFGQKFSQQWYDRVVDACALRPDLEMLPSGDATEIGERGITVSGGQKQRLNIARAIYFNADIVLLDDPLSAVDAHVGRHIMDNAICGLLRGKCRVLVTHQLHVLNRCDRIVWMDQGRIKVIGTFDDLMAHNEDFKQLMKTTAVEQSKEKDKDEMEDEVAEEKKEQTTKNTKRGKALMTVEERAVAALGWDVYLNFIKASGGIWVAPLVFIFLILAQGSNIVTSLWLSYWTSNKYDLSTGAYIGIYAALGVSQAIFMFLFALSLSFFGTQASKHMLRDAMRQVLRAPMSFFDTTPLGRITNRFAKDIDVMDNNLTDSMRMYFMTLGTIFGIFGLIIAYFHFFAVALAPLMLLFLASAGYYRASAREIKRHEAVERSYVFARFSEAVTGVATIRAYGLQDQFKSGIRDAIDNMNSAYFLTFSNQRWLSIRLDALGNLMVFTVGILVVTSRFSINPSIGGLVLSYILSIVQMVQFTVRQLAEVENNFNSAERLNQYITKLESEAPLHLTPVPKSWPEHGDIIFDDVQMRYRDGLPLVLKGLNLHVKAGERIGIVGRTGAGKSSIMSTLFRMVELSGGSIKIDGINIATVGLYDLRTRLSIIPQDPTLFRGTIRTNLDPFEEHTDAELWSALRSADLVGQEPATESSSNQPPPSTISPIEEKGEGKDAEKEGKALTTTTFKGTTNLPAGRIQLDTLVEEEGLNFSLGQRQLMALARALVRGSQIIVCDEATSSVDFETDLKIQKTMQTAFAGKTLLCIAHRLKTIISYDRIVVMDQGVIAEVDSPLNLFDKPEGIFHGMCARSGITREEIEQFNFQSVKPVEV